MLDDNQQNDAEMEISDEAQNEADKIVRKNYRKIKNDLTENRLEFIDPNSNAIENTLDSLNQNFKQVKKPREGVADVQNLLQIAILFKDRVKNVRCEFRSFNNNEFMEKLKIYMLNCDKTRKKPAQSRYKEDDDNEDNNYEIDNEDEDEDENVPRTSTGARRSTQSTRKRSSLADDYTLTKNILTNFGKNVMNYFRIPPRPTFLVGSLDKEILFTQKRARQVRQKVDKEQLEAAKTKIKELTVNSEEDENSTFSETQRIHEILKKIFKKLKGNPVCLYTFVVNPFSFSRTIENIFYTSFLVKDGYAKIYLGLDELPVIEPVLENIQQKSNTQHGMNKNCIQSMISLTKAQWRDIIDTFGLNSALIPNPS